MAWLWERRLYRPGLRTTDGRAVQVIYPGWRWGSWGPDFRAALLTIDGALTRGDVEIHVRARDWDRHGHATDPAYDAVVLQVVHELDDAPPATRHDGVAVPSVALSSALDAPVETLLASWRLGLLPGSASGLDSAFRLRSCLSSATAIPVLEHAGLERFRAKSSRFEGDLAIVTPGQALWTGLLETLGYANNTGPFRALAERVPLAEAMALARLEGDRALQAVMLGEAGLLPSQRGKASPDGYGHEVEEAWDREHRRATGPGLFWRWVGARPANTPTRRVVAAASLVGDAPGLPSARDVFSLLADVAPDAFPSVAARSLRRWLTREGPPYWRSHADFGHPLRRACAILGPQRAAEAVVNVVLPWAAALARTWDREDLVRAAEACYRAHPLLGGNHITRHMADQILGAQAGAVLTTACRQQGLIHIYRTSCDARDCATCLAGTDELRAKSYESGPVPFTHPS